MLPDSTPEAVAAHYSWLKPHFFDESTGDLGSRIQTVVVRTPEHTVVIDTCVGHDKGRARSPPRHLAPGPYPHGLAGPWVEPDDVDYVVCTHLHVDHVGWNTRLVNGRWVPTFGRAIYVFAGEEWNYWRHEKDMCIADSVVPIVESGRAVLVDDDYAIDAW